jgi:hypothetical protein
MRCSPSLWKHTSFSVIILVTTTIVSALPSSSSSSELARVGLRNPSIQLHPQQRPATVRRSESRFLEFVEKGWPVRVLVFQVGDERVESVVESEFLHAL